MALQDPGPGRGVARAWATSSSRWRAADLQVGARRRCTATTTPTCVPERTPLATTPLTTGPTTTWTFTWPGTRPGAVETVSSDCKGKFALWWSEFDSDLGGGDKSRDSHFILVFKVYFWIKIDADLCEPDWTVPLTRTFLDESCDFSECSGTSSDGCAQWKNTRTLYMVSLLCWFWWLI